MNFFYKRRKNLKVSSVNEINTNSIKNIIEYLKNTKYESNYNFSINVEYFNDNLYIFLQPNWTKRLINYYKPVTVATDETFSVCSIQASKLTLIRIRTNSNYITILYVLSNNHDYSFFVNLFIKVINLIPSLKFITADSALAPIKAINNLNNRFYSSGIQLLYHDWCNCNLRIQ